MEPTESSPQSNKPASPNNGKIVTGIISALVIVAAIFGITKYKNDTPAQTAALTSTSTSVSSTSAVTASTSAYASAYKDGTYSAEGNYDTPAGTEQLAVSLTLKNGIVTAAQVTSEAKAPESKRYQGMFISGYTPYVVGKDVSSLNLTKVSGSSLTPKGFDDAVSKIKAEAQA